MFYTILGITFPIIVTLLLGFVAAWHHDFSTREASILNRMVITYAVPLSIFAGTIETSRDYLLDSAPLVLSVFGGIIGMYALIYLLCFFLFRFSIGGSALASVTAAGPAVPFFGPAILGDVFGVHAAIPIAIASIAINITIVPITIFLLTIERSARKKAKAGTVDSTVDSVPVEKVGLQRRPFSIQDGALPVLWGHLGETFRKPLVWMPLLGVGLVLFNIHLPRLVTQSFFLLGKSSAGVALFAAGIVLAAYQVKCDRYTLFFVFLKNIAQPGLMLLILLSLHVSHIIIAQTVISLAIPAMPIIVMLALEYEIAEDYIPSILLLSTVLSPLTVGGFIAVTQ